MKFTSLFLLPSAIHAFTAPSTRHVNTLRPHYLPIKTRLHQQQPFYNEADGQTYYYNSSDGNYYSETGQMYVDNQQYDQQYNQQQVYDQQYQQQAYNDQQYDTHFEDQQQQPPSQLILGNDIASEMSQLISEAGIDYLSLAKQRALEKRESINNISTDDDWLNLAEEVRVKKQQEQLNNNNNEGGEKDDEWEASLNEESEGDAAALGMGTFVTEAGIVVEGNYGDEPTLLLWETWVNMFYTHMHMSETFWGV